MAGHLPSHPKSSHNSTDQNCHKRLYESLRNKNVPFILKGDSEWDKLTASFNVRLHYEPLLVVVPQTTQHISHAIICASDYGIHFQAKSGGHSYASFSNGGVDGIMIIHLCNFGDVAVDQDTGIAKVGGGTRLGPLGHAVWEQGRRALAHGTCSAVGIGGHYSHGGYGHFSRHWGLAMDHIVALDVVLADGSLVFADKDSHTDVFYAMRGAADMIGIAVNFYLQTHAAPEKVVKWEFDLATCAPANDVELATDTFIHLQAVANDASFVDHSISFGIVLGPNEWFNVGGAYLGSLKHFNNIIIPELLRGLPKPKKVKVMELSWIDTLKHFRGDDLTVADPYLTRSNFYAKSVTIPEPGAPCDSMRDYMSFIATKGQSKSFGWYAIFDLYGGPGSQINTHGLDFAAYRDRESMWVVQHQVFVGNDAEFPVEGIEFLNGLNGALTYHMRNCGAYLPYIDSEYDKAMAKRMYYGEELYAKLKQIKQRVDPKNVFANPHSIEP